MFYSSLQSQNSSGTPHPERLSGLFTACVSIRPLTVQEGASAPEGKSGKRVRAVAIVSGMSLNKHLFGADCLKEAIPLFAGIPVYSNHPKWPSPSHDVDSLRGEFVNPEWSNEEQAIVGDIEFLESAAKMRQDIAEKPHLFGWSIIAESEYIEVYDNEGRYLHVELTKIQRVLSLDAVDFPAAGGRTLEVLESRQGPVTSGVTQEERRMNGNVPNMISEDAAKLRLVESETRLRTENETQLRTLTEAHDKALAAQRTEIVELKANFAEAEKRANDLATKLAVIEEAKAKADTLAFVEDALKDSDLPKTVQESIRKNFTGRPASQADVRNFVESQTKLVAELRESLGPVVPSASGAAPAPSSDAPTPSGDKLIRESAEVAKNLIARISARVGVTE